MKITVLPTTESCFFGTLLKEETGFACFVDNLSSSPDKDFALHRDDIAQDKLVEIQIKMMNIHIRIHGREFFGKP